MPKPTNSNHLLALDIGDKRVGVATASLDSLLAKPLITLDNNQQLIGKINQLIANYRVKTIVVGLPRTLSGEDSQQTRSVREVIDRLKTELKVKVLAQDEALSSVRAEEELSQRGKIHKKADIDKLAACLILEDYIASHKS